VSIKSKDYLLVALQLLLFTLYFWSPCKITIYQGNDLSLIALVLVIIGVIIMLLAVYALRKSISPFPSPRKNAVLIQHGIFKFIRHPIYTSILLTTLGWAFYSNSLFRIFIFAMLIILFEIKSNFEEDLLIKRFTKYANYIKITGKYLPKIN
jgi:protein-S-isoprenylcysteine O-methyltransferase Ste14